MRIILLMLIVSSFVFSNDTLNVSTTSKHGNSFLVTNQETQKVFLTNEQSFFEKYQSLIGSIIGSFFAAIIALLSIWITRRNQNKKTNIEYFSQLATIHSILVSHGSNFDALLRELNQLFEDFKITKRIAYDKTFTFIPNDLLKQLFIKISAYENSDISIIYKLSGYIISIDELSNDLNFNIMKKIKDDIPSEAEYINRVEDYFNRLQGKVRYINERAKEISNDIMK